MAELGAISSSPHAHGGIAGGIYHLDKATGRINAYSSVAAVSIELKFAVCSRLNLPLSCRPRNHNQQMTPRGRAALKVGIGHSDQPMCLHAHWRSQARSKCCSNSLLTPRPYRTQIQFPCNFNASKKKAHHKGELFVLLVETAGIEPASASTLQAVLHT